MTTRHTNPEGRQGVTPRQRLAAYALGLAGGMGVNTLSNDFGYRGMATAAAAAAILISTNWLRQLPSQAPLPRIVSRVLLGGAALAAIVAAANPSWEGPATIAATILTTLAVLIPTALERTTELLFGVYPTKIKLTEAQKNSIPIERHTFHGEWNYTIKPAPNK